MSKVLLLFAHPLLEKSRIHGELLAQAASVPNVTINDLYERYPEFDIDVSREKHLLLTHDIIIWQFPFYWYSAPPMLKQWQDLVLEHGWAYGKKGVALTGKKVFTLLSTGAGINTYQPGGFNKYPIHNFLHPFERTAELCKMIYYPPYWIPGVHVMNLPLIKQHSEQYKNMLTALTNDIFSEEEILSHSLMSDLFPVTSNET